MPSDFSSLLLSAFCFLLFEKTTSGNLPTTSGNRENEIKVLGPHFGLPHFVDPRFHCIAPTPTIQRFPFPTPATPALGRRKMLSRCAHSGSAFG